VIEEPGATTYVPPGWACVVDARLNLVVDWLDDADGRMTT
jgi:hypothetical protein